MDEVSSAELDSLRVYNNLANLYKKEKKYDKAEPLFKNVLDISRRLLGENLPESYYAMNNLAVFYYEQVTPKFNYLCLVYYILVCSTAQI